MTTKPTSRKRPTVHEVAGADDEVRGRVSSSADAVHGAAGNLRLQLQRGKRRAQLVRGIGGEAALCDQGLVEPNQ